MTELADVIRFVQAADEGTLDRIGAAIKSRHSRLRREGAEATAAAIKVGTKVLITRVSPKYLSGRGKVVAVHNDSCDVEYDVVPFRAVPRYLPAGEKVLRRVKFSMLDVLDD